MGINYSLDQIQKADYVARQKNPSLLKTHEYATY